MAKLEISGRGLIPNHLIVKLDGVEITKLITLELSLEMDKPNECSLVFYPDEIEIDTEVLMELEARLNKTHET